MQQDIVHPENDACYEGLAVNKGIEQPDPVNPAIAERLKHLNMFPGYSGEISTY